MLTVLHPFELRRPFADSYSGHTRADKRWNALSQRCTRARAGTQLTSAASPAFCGRADATQFP